jgi:hypothetical protein
VRRITGGEGEVGEKLQELTAGSGVAGIEEGRCGDGGSTDNRAGAARSRGGGGVPATGVQEGGEEVARKLPRIDVVLVVSSVRAKRGRSSGTTVTLNGGGEECGRTDLNYTGSNTRVHSRGLQRASNGIIPWPVG